MMSDTIGNSEISRGLRIAPLYKVYDHQFSRSHLEPHRLERAKIYIIWYGRPSIEGRGGGRSVRLYAGESREFLEAPVKTRPGMVQNQSKSATIKKYKG